MKIIHFYILNIYYKKKINLNIKGQRLVFQRMFIINDKTIAEYNIKDEFIIYLILIIY